MSYELAGDRIRLEEREDGSALIHFDDKGTGRVCGSCTLCCKLLPVPTIDKPAGTRCKHAKVGKGCIIHATKPFACKSWTCRWLADAKTAGLHRPDRSHYVIDLQYDYITTRDNLTGEKQRRQVLQIWVDPAFPDAHRDPGLREYLARMAEKYGVAALIRWNSEGSAMLLAPPVLTKEKEWIEVRTSIVVPEDSPER